AFGAVHFPSPAAPEGSLPDPAAMPLRADGGSPRRTFRAAVSGMPGAAPVRLFGLAWRPTDITDHRSGLRPSQGDSGEAGANQLPGVPSPGTVVGRTGSA